MSRLMLEGDGFLEVPDGFTPRESMVDVRPGERAMHISYGVVQNNYTQELGWHYLRYGFAGRGGDFENLTSMRMHSEDQQVQLAANWQPCHRVMKKTDGSIIDGEVDLLAPPQWSGIPG